MLLQRIMERDDAQQFINELLDNEIPRNRDKGSDPIFVRSYVVQHHWRRRWVRNGKGRRSNARKQGSSSGVTGQTGRAG